jgi:hypothetical protein
MKKKQGHHMIIKELVNAAEDADELLAKRDREGLTALHIAIMATQPSAFSVIFLCN